MPKNEPDAPRANAPILVTAGRFGDLCGVHQNTVTNWLKAGMPVDREDRRAMVNVALGVQWVLAKHEREMQALRARTDPEGARAAKTAAEAKLKELDLAERQGQVVRADQVEADRTQEAMAVREGVMAIPGIAVQQGTVVPGKEMELEALCRDALTGVTLRLLAAADVLADTPDEEE